jgi:hypothetical protein
MELADWFMWMFEIELVATVTLLLGGLQAERLRDRLGVAAGGPPAVRAC